ncbi:MAG: glycosyltransferase family 1 protein [Candidatus Doudnabacteria bacterium]|nr:glycosyltransferase family 1 protein [Candidatus Doudnabacteria bacterium]
MLGSRHGGIGRYSLELSKHLLALDRRNLYCLFINPASADKSDVDLLSKYSNTKIIASNIRHYSIKEQSRFYKQLNMENLDLVHFPNFNVPLLYKKPFVVTIHDMVHHKISGHKKSHFLQFLAYKKIIQDASVKARAIITVSNHSKKEIHKYLNAPLEKIYVIYEGSNLNCKISENAVASVKEKFFLQFPYFLFVGVLERKKNLPNLTRGFDLFLEKNKFKMDLVIVGKADKHYPEIRHKAMDIKHNNRLIFTDFVEDPDLSALYKGAFAFVSASLHEGFGLPGIEAMKFNLPLVVSNTEVFNEIYDNAAIYFNPLDPNDISEKMKLLAADSQFYQKQRANSAARADFFDWNNTAQETLLIYNSIINSS